MNHEDFLREYTNILLMKMMEKEERELRMWNVEGASPIALQAKADFVLRRN